MAQFLEFVANHWILSLTWVILLLALIAHRTRSGSRAVGPQEAVMLINRQDGIILDVRDKKEFDSGHIVDAIHIPAAKVASRVAELSKYKSRPVIVVCKIGQHSADTCKVLVEQGFEHVVRMRGGMAEWRSQNLPVTQKS